MEACPTLDPVVPMKTQTTLLLSSLQSMQQRYQPIIESALREILDKVHETHLKFR